MRGARWVMAFGLLLGGCGSDDDGEAGTSAVAAEVTTTPGPTTAAVSTTETPILTETVDTASTSLPITTAGAAGGVGLDACQLLGPDEVAATLQLESVTDGVEQPAALLGGVACQWDSEDPAVPAFVRLELVGADPDQSRSLLDTIAPDTATDPVAGVGDDARWDRLTNTLAVLSDGNVLAVEVLTNAPEEDVSRMLAAELALTVLPRLQQ